MFIYFSLVVVYHYFKLDIMKKILHMLQLELPTCDYCSVICHQIVVIFLGWYKLLPVRTIGFLVIISIFILFIIGYILGLITNDIFSYLLR